MKKRYVYALSFLLPLLTLLLGMVIFGVAPFGDQSLLIIDGLHQYIPFFSILYDKLHAGESLFYTFRTGLGINFLALFSYYLSSPLNLLIAFFPREQLNAVVSCLIVLKLALSGLAASIYFAHRSKNPDWHVVAVSVAYALNGYMVGYSWNVMWLDAIMILPVILLGIEKLIDENDGRIYGLALFYALYCNYYIGFMICIFSVIWYLFHPFRSFKQFFTRGFAFAIYSFLAAGMSAVLLIPAYLGIKATSSGNAMGLPEHSWLTNFWNLILRQFNMVQPISHDNFDGNANLYFGIFTIIFVFLYLLNRKISIFEKGKKVLLILFFYVSFHEEILNFIWHGFHNQYGIPNRFSFLYGFVLLLMAFDVLENMEEIRMLEPLLALLGAGALLAVSYWKSENELPADIAICAGILILCYGVFLLLFKVDDCPLHHSFYKTMVLASITLEMMVTSLLGFQYNGQINIPKFFSASKDLVAAVEKQKDGSLYRSELAKALMVDESTYYPMNGVGLFGSTARDEMVKFMDSLGFYTGCNEYLYQGATPLTDLMFNVRYLYYHEADQLYTNYPLLEQEGSVRTYRNPIEGMSMGYVIDPMIEDWYYQSDYPFRVLEDFCMQGYEVSGVFKNIPVNDPVVSGCTVDNTNKGEYFFHYQEKKPDNLVFSITMPEETDNLMLFYDGTQVDTVEVAMNGLTSITGDLDGRVIPVGPVQKGTVINVTMSLKGESSSGYIRLSAADFDQKAFQEVADAMTSHALEIHELSDHQIKGTIQADKDSYLFFSIPYDKGWTVSVDGIPVETMTMGDALLAIRIPKGDHGVTLHYEPEGFCLGALISAGSFLFFLLLCVRTHFWKRKKKALLKKQTLMEEQTPMEEQIPMEENVQDTASEEEGQGNIRKCCSRKDKTCCRGSRGRYCGRKRWGIHRRCCRKAYKESMKKMEE